MESPTPYRVPINKRVKQLLEAAKRTGKWNDANEKLPEQARSYIVAVMSVDGKLYTGTSYWNRTHWTIYGRVIAWAEYPMFPESENIE